MSLLNPTPKELAALHKARLEPAPDLTEEQKEAIKQALEKLRDDQTPNPDGTCKARRCRGRVVQKVGGSCGGRIFYRTPECAKCGRKYREADRDQTPRVGEEQFRKSLRTVYD